MSGHVNLPKSYYYNRSIVRVAPPNCGCCCCMGKDIRREKGYDKLEQVGYTLILFLIKYTHHAKGNCTCWFMCYVIL